MKKIFVLLVLVSITSCATASLKNNSSAYDPSSDSFLTDKPKSKTEVFRVVMTGKDYIISQKSYLDTIKRVEDESGDNYFVEEISALNQISESREGVVEVGLYPDSGKLIQVRFVQSSFLREIDQMIFDDIQRWNYEFPKKKVDPIKFTVRYKVVLEKSVSEDDMVSKMRQQMKERTGQ